MRDLVRLLTDPSAAPGTPVRLTYRGFDLGATYYLDLGATYYLDMLVNDTVIVAVECVSAVSVAPL